MRQNQKNSTNVQRERVHIIVESPMHGVCCESSSQYRQQLVSRALSGTLPTKEELVAFMLDTNTTRIRLVSIGSRTKTPYLSFTLRKTGATPRIGEQEKRSLDSDAARCAEMRGLDANGLALMRQTLRGMAAKYHLRYVLSLPKAHSPSF